MLYAPRFRFLWLKLNKVVINFCLFVNSVRILYLGFSSLGIFMVLGGFIYIYIYYIGLMGFCLFLLIHECVGFVWGDWHMC